MPRILPVLLGVVLSCLLSARPAHAQPEAFVAAVRDLAGTTRGDRANDGERMAAVMIRLSDALAEWDRRLAALETSVVRELPGASDERAYALHVQLGVAYRARGRNADALRAFDAALARRPSSSDLHLLRALTLDLLDRHDEADRAYRAAWRFDPASAMKAYYALQHGARDPAERDRIRTALADAYQRLDTVGPRPSMPPFPVLDAITDRLVSSPVIGDQVTGPAFHLFAAGRYTEAVAALNAASSSPGANSPADAFARAQRDEADNRLPDARREYEAALAGALTGRRVVYVGLARLAQVDGDPAAAIAAFRRAVACDPNDINVHKELAAAYAADGRADEAYAELVAALLIDPRDAQAHGDLGRLLLDNGRDHEAVVAFTRALAVNDGAYELHYAMATALTRLGRAADAARELETYERLRRLQLDNRRRTIAADVERAEAIRRERRPRDTAP